jgi:hypothetical protein
MLSDRGLVIKRMKPDSPAIHSKRLRVGQCVVAIGALRGVLGGLVSGIEV